MQKEEQNFGFHQYHLPNSTKFMLENKDQLIHTVSQNVIKFGEYDVVQAASLLDASLRMAREHPEKVLRSFAIYDRVIQDLFDLKPDELALIKRVNEKLGKNRGADEFMETMGSEETKILYAVHHAGGMQDRVSQEGITELAFMMKNAAQLKQKEPDWKPTDGDPRSDTVIWGFVNGANDPNINMHFVICHGIERILTQASPLEYTKHKDWLLSALTDVVALRGLQGKFPETKLLSLWGQKRPDGLGWISQSRQNEYNLHLGGANERDYLDALEK